MSDYAVPVHAASRQQFVACPSALHDSLLLLSVRWRLKMIAVALKPAEDGPGQSAQAQCQLGRSLRRRAAEAHTTLIN